jgi:P27 family predicted phage terminase small subunit
MPRTKKPAGQAADSRNGTHLELVAVEREDMPCVPTGLKRQTSRDLWRSYWTDVVSGLVHESEAMIVERWVSNVDRYTVLMSIAEETPFETGSQGQTVKHPAWTVALALESSIRADEAQLGYGPKNRAALGIAVVQQQASLAEMNQRYGGPSTEEQPDPRMMKEQ